MGNKPEGIGYDPEKYPKVQNLMYQVNAETLRMAYERQQTGKATGVDKVTKEEYGVELARNIEGLVGRMKSFSYKPQPVRRAYIPKANGKLRPLGIPAFEDKLVQGVMASLLNEVYEPRFLDCSYGFRPGKSCHDVVRYMNETIRRRPINYVLEADIKGFFDNVDHDWLMKFLEHDIDDKNFLRYIKRFLIGGVMEGTKLMDSDKGTPQGGLISPILANVYLHYVLDLWFEKAIKPRIRGEACYVRYADDFLIMFQYREEAERVLAVLGKRLGKFALELAEDKTRIVPVGRNSGPNDKFEFLGFEFYNTKTRIGTWRLGIRTSPKKLKLKKEALKQWMRGQLTVPLEVTMTTLNRKLQGHANYYGINGNYKSLENFWLYAKQRMYWMICRRSQKAHISWDKAQRIWDYFIGKPRIKVQIWC